MRASDQSDNILSKIIDPQIGSSKHDEITIWLYEKIKSDENYQNAMINKYFKNKWDLENWNFLKKDIILEFPLRNERNKSICGFADLFAYFMYEHKTKTYSHLNEKTQYPLQEEVRLLVEVKTSVNIGETIRQINYYRNNSQGAQWFVCAPDFNQSHILKEQGIGFIPYKP